MKLNTSAEVKALVTPETSTVIWDDPEPVGLTAIQLRLLEQFTDPARVLPNITVVAPKAESKPAALIVTAVPPLSEPDDGLMAVTTGPRVSLPDPNWLSLPACPRSSPLPSRKA